MEKSSYVASGFNYFGCKVCNVRGIPYTAATLSVHLDTRSHKIMKALYDNGLWPGPPEKYECSERRVQVYKFLDSRGTVLCEACNKVLPDAQTLFKHQQAEEHRKALKEKDLDIPMIYMCEVCDVLLCGLDNYYNHCWSSDHQNVVEKLKSTKKSVKVEKKSENGETSNKQEVQQQNGEENSSSASSKDCGAAECAMSEVSASDSSDSNHSSEDQQTTVKIETSANDPASKHSPSLVNSEHVQNLLQKLQQTSGSAQNPANFNAAQEYLTNNTPPNANAVAFKAVKAAETAENNSFSPSSTVSSLSQPATHLTPTASQPDTPSTDDQQRINALLASLAAGMKQQNAPQEQPPPASQTLFDMLMQKPAESTMNQINWLSQLLAAQQQQQAMQQQQQAYQQKVDAMNNLDYVLDAYLNRETQWIQMKQAKLADLASLRGLITESREKNTEFEMSTSEIVRLTEVITGRLNTVPQPELNIMAEFGYQIQQLHPAPAPAVMVSPLNEYFATLITNLAAAAAAGQNAVQSSNEIKPRFVNKDDLQQQQHHQQTSGRSSMVSSSSVEIRRESRGERPGSRENRERPSSRQSRERPVSRESRDRPVVSRRRSRSRSPSLKRDHQHHYSSNKRSPPPSQQRSHSRSSSSRDDYYHHRRH